MEWFSDLLLPFGFAGVGQDMRGTEMSEGNFTMWQADKFDSKDLGDWIVSQPWSNGEIYTIGASADGIGSLQTVKTNPKWLKGQYIIWCTSEAFEFMFPGGTYKQQTAEDWLKGLTMPNPDYVNTDIEIVHQNEAYTDWWAGVEVSDEQFGLVDYPTGVFAGWYDLFLQGSISAWRGFNEKSQLPGNSVLFIDPCGHCLEAGAYFPQHTVDGRSAIALAQIYETFGVRKNKRDFAVKQVTFYVMSSNDDAGHKAGNYWTSMDAFPQAKATEFYLMGDKTISMNAPTSDSSASTQYKHDPANPIPTLGGNNLPASIGGDIPCGPLDQSPIDSRDDVLTFDLPVSTEELVLTGSMKATLYVSSDAIDTDFMVRISDVYNNDEGTVALIMDNAIRMRWRETTLEPVYMEKGTVYKITVDLWTTSYIVAPGHQLRVAISSSNYPRFSVNNNNGVVLDDSTYPGEQITAINTLYHSGEYPSSITLPVVSKKDLPEIHVLHAVQSEYPHITDQLISKFSKYLEQKASKKL